MAPSAHVTPVHSPLVESQGSDVGSSGSQGLARAALQVLPEVALYRSPRMSRWVSGVVLPVVHCPWELATKDARTKVACHHNAHPSPWLTGSVLQWQSEAHMACAAPH